LGANLEKKERKFGENDPPNVPPQNCPTPEKGTPSIYIYIYRESVKERERDMERAKLWDIRKVILGEKSNFRKTWALPVASCLCRAYTMPTHYNNLKRFVGRSPPGECLNKLVINLELYVRNESPAKTR